MEIGTQKTNKKGRLQSRLLERKERENRKRVARERVVNHMILTNFTHSCPLSFFFFFLFSFFGVGFDWSLYRNSHQIVSVFIIECLFCFRKKKEKKNHLLGILL